MLTGVHVVVFTKDAEAARGFLAEALGFPSVDAGGGWQIFRPPPAELAPHPADEAAPPALYLMCDDIQGTKTELAEKGAKLLAPVTDEGWGLLTSIETPEAPSSGSTSRSTRPHMNSGNSPPPAPSTECPTAHQPLRR